MRKIVLSADSACDLDERLREEYGVNICPYHVILGEKHYQDGVDITPDQIYEVYYRDKILPKTAAINPQDFIDRFKPWIEDGYEVIHVSLSSAITSSYQNCCLAAKELSNVYPVDSRSLSTGFGLLVIEAAKRIAQGMPAIQIQEELNTLRQKIEASFILDNLTFMHAGGRCSGVAALGANILNIKPCIEVENATGKMRVGKKYRGTLEKVLKKYTEDRLSGRTDLNLERVFITHTGIAPEIEELVKNTIRENADFEEILVTRAGCTVSSHSGPNTLGVLFLRK